MLSNLVKHISFQITNLSLSFSVPLHVSCVVFKKGELEKLNQSTDDINRWESELEVSGNSNTVIVSPCWGKHSQPALQKYSSQEAIKSDFQLKMSCFALNKREILSELIVRLVSSAVLCVFLATGVIALKAFSHSIYDGNFLIARAASG